jgi:hypothetical protein
MTPLIQPRSHHSPRKTRSIPTIALVRNYPMEHISRKKQALMILTALS